MFLENPRFPDNISYGSSGGPLFNNTIIVVDSGFEYTNINWDIARHRYDVAMGVRSQEELTELITFFQIVRGNGYYFRYKDWTDYTCTNQHTKQITSTTYQMYKRYDNQNNLSIVNDREITKPVEDTITVYESSVENSNNTINYTTGLITFVSPPAGEITYDGEFDVPVRFDTNELNISLDFYQHGSTGVPIIEVKV